MGPTSQKKRRLEESRRGDRQVRPKKRIRHQKAYHSSSSEDEDSEGSEKAFTPVNLNDSDDEDTTAPPRSKTTTAQKKIFDRKQSRKLKSTTAVGREYGADEESESNSDSNTSSQSDGEEEPDTDTEINALNAKRSERTSTSKRNDPLAFSTSITKILSTKLPHSARSDPLLSRSRSAAETSAALANERLEKKARAKIRSDKKAELERGRVRDVLGLESGRAGEVAEEEKKLRKIAQRGVVKLFNAVRAAQVRGEQAMKEERKKGTVGMKNREEKVREVTKEGFLDLISGKTSAKVAAKG